MDHYVDLRVFPDPESSRQWLMEVLFGRLHLALVELDTEDVGVSFPEAEVTLGGNQRIHSSLGTLRLLMGTHWLKGLQDYVETGEILPVPSLVQYRRVRRVQVRSGSARLRRRYMKRHSVTEADAIRLYPDSIEQRSELPYLHVDSGSTGQRFRLFIEQGNLKTEPLLGTFSSYGLSDTATVPWF